MSETMQENAPVDVQEDYTTGFDDYFGVDETKKVFLGSDGKQHVVIKVMTEGQRAKFEKDNNQDLRVSREGDTTIKVDPGRSRKALLKAAIVDWFIVGPPNPTTHQRKPLNFEDGNLNRFIDNTSPSIIDKIEKAIRDLNPWLKNDLSVEELKKEIANLEKELAEKMERERGE